MGRRSINTTKSGKYMNPTDQARKEARKKELKKNKKQRQLVRAAVLKGKDPFLLIGEMEKIDNMEYNVLQPSPLNEKVLKDKRRKLRETLDRVLKMYIKEDPEKWEELKRAEAEYEKRRMTMATYSEAVRHAQQVQVDDIPLPLAQLHPENMMALGLTSQIPLPDMPMSLLLPPTSILRKRSAYSPPRTKAPPGVPPGPPPELSSDEDEDVAPGTEEKVRPRMIRFADKDDSDGEDISKRHDEGKKNNESTIPVPAPSGQLPIGLPPAPPPLGNLIVGIRPPGPPPGLPPRLMGIRLPPGPPPGLPPRMMPPRLPSSIPTPNVLSAAPQLIRKDGQMKGPTIEAKAQIRNLTADVTRFVPTALRVKRNDDKPLRKPEQSLKVDIPKPQATKDDAYSQFMREMEGLL
ncbi:WW domain-binding protein 11 [Cimex lectularius]|uniref:Wbp11/ELF5/Saf1 N-terminal domain-containing protein n=1 Tax=Cimex lectularius TaxID=79782 RepID=A0A8I6RCA9_CIMLE|nr:WW domain-binding protein 11 [Cimex lectularius]